MRSMVAGNWKMNGTRQDATELVTAIVAQEDYQCDVLICPPFVFMQQVSSLIENSHIKLGAQNVDWHIQGAFTGEISVSMVREFGCRYVLTGHSERRTLFDESDDVVATKFKAVIDAGMTPILCVGETLSQRQASETHEVINRQISAVLDHVSSDEFSRGIIAYEPLWAIGTGKTATPDLAAGVHAGIRQFVAEVDCEMAENMRILYGGSVNGGNADELMAMEDINGVLVGGASLKSKEFIAICKAAGAN